MGCSPTKKSETRDGGQKFVEFKLDNLEDTGREQFFWHYPHSELPIRDITAKTEPHIEIGAENYLWACIQRNVRGFCQSSEKYLFLCTTCKNSEIWKGTFSGKRFVVGYIEKKGQKNMGNHLAVIGDTYIVPFDEGLEYRELGFKRSRGMQKFDEKRTKKLLNLIKKHKNIRNKCIEEMIRMENEERKNGKTIPLDSECLDYKNKCAFKNECLRRSLK